MDAGSDPVTWNWFGRDAGRLKDRLERGLDDPLRWMGLIALAVAAFYLLAAILVGVGTWVEVLRGNTPAASGEPLSEAVLVYQLALNLVVYGGAPLLWVAIMYANGSGAWTHRLWLRRDRWFGDFGWGVLGAVGMVLLTPLLAGIAEGFGDDATSDTVRQLVSLSYPTLVFVAFAAGISEELFYRGLLQPRIGIVPTNLLFAAAHLGFGTAAQVVVPLVFGFGFSYLVLRRASLWPAMVAHIVFDLAQLTLGKIGSEAGWF